MDFYNKNLFRIVAIIVIIAILSWYVPSHPQYSYIFWIFIISIALLAIKFNNFSDGEDGEWAVEDELKKLPSEFTYIHNLENDKGNIDFVVVCPKGIFTIEVKSTRWIQDYYEKGLKQAFAEARKVEEILKNKLGIDLPVDPILMYSNKETRLKFGFKPQKGVYVINLLWLQKFFDEYQVARELDQKKIDTIVNALKVSQKK